jgi:predicted nucleotidyltransferase
MTDAVFSENVAIAPIIPVLEGRAEILAAYLFGSASRSAAAPRDLDLAVILSQSFEPDRFYEFTLAEELEKASGSKIPVDLKIMNRSPLYFQFKILREGRLVFNRDNAQRGRYEVGVMMRYYDFKPFLDYYNRCLHEMIKAS